MDLGLTGKTVIITGGTKGIGAGIARVFAEEGANLILDYRSDKEHSENYVSELRRQYGVQVYGIQEDISQPEKIPKIFDFAEEKLGRIDILINNAGGGVTTSLCEISLDEWNSALDNNLTAMFLMSQEYAKRMIAANRKGAIVNILSKASMSTTTKGRACYVTNKTAEMGLTKQLAVDLMEYGIIVNGVMPGAVKNQVLAGLTEEERIAWTNRCPMKKLGEPEEIGKMAAFLASEDNQLTIGAAVDCTGGLLLGF